MSIEIIIGLPHLAQGPILEKVKSLPASPDFRERPFKMA